MVDDKQSLQHSYVFLQQLEPLFYRLAESAFKAYLNNDVNELKTSLDELMQTRKDGRSSVTTFYPASLNMQEILYKTRTNR